MQVFNPAAGTLGGRFVFHPAGASSSLADPSLSLSFSVAAGQTISYSDILQAMGQTGIGSLDLVLPTGDYIPVVSALVFNDAGAAGTSGFAEDAIDPTLPFLGSAVLMDGTGIGFVLGPLDTRRFRFNIGVRTFFAGATLSITVRDSSGAVVGTKQKEYPPTFFEQVDASTLMGGSLSSNESFEISVVGPGLATVYGVTVDNTTNDPSIQFAHGVLSNLDVHPAAEMIGSGASGCKAQ